MATNKLAGGASRARGFASMNADRQREIASMGGRAAHAKGTAHEFSSAEAQAAGRRGGKASHHPQAVANMNSARDSGINY